MASREKNLGRTTSLAVIQTFHVDEQGEEHQKSGYEVLESIANLYSLEPPKQDDQTLTLNLEDLQCSLKLVKSEASNAFITVVKRPDGVKYRGLEEDTSAYEQGIHKILMSLPDNPTATFSVYIVINDTRDDAQATLKEYLAHQTQSHISSGIIRGGFLAMWGSTQQEVEMKTVERSFLLSSFDASITKKMSSELLEEIGTIASIEGEIHRLHRMRQPFFRMISTVEEDTNKTVDELISKSFLNSTKLEDLEESLKMVTGRFSTLSMMAGAVRRDNITVGYMLDEVENLLKRWNESQVEGYPTVYMMEMIECKALSKPFRDFIDRIESLRVELETVLDTVRTYLSVEQQKLGVEEQKSSKSLLAKLVNLQEALNKLEVLIVAFYITEMAGLLFEVISRDIAPLLTAIFVPLAFVVSLGLTRLIHSNREK